MNASPSLFSTHGQVLMVLARRPDLRLRDVADAVGLTERAVQAIVNELVGAGYLDRIREGRRNRYLIHGERAVPNPTARVLMVSELVGPLAVEPLTGPTASGCKALVLACTDYRYQEPLRTLLGNEGLLGAVETTLVPGGASALGGRDAGRILAALELMAGALRPERLLLVAHQGCWVPGAFVASRPDPFTTRRVVADRRRRTVARVRRRLALDPELWFLDDRGAKRVRGRGRHPFRAVSGAVEGVAS
ncbi:hypothetical protein BH20ACT24_BH20ACT24_08930 [soil metagenome]